MMRAGWTDPFPAIGGVRWQGRTSKEPWALYAGHLIVYERSAKVKGAFRYSVYKRRFGYPDEPVGRAATAEAAAELALGL